MSTDPANAGRLLVLIPVRGGSKGVPRKNLRPVAGKPLVLWTVEHALALAGELSGHAVDVLVSTDDDELADLAREAGAEVPWRRPAALAQDTTPTEPVVEHAIAAQTAAGREPDRVLLLQATSPVRRPGTLARAVAQLTDERLDSLVGVVPHPPFLWRWPSAPGGDPVAEYDVERRRRRQDMGPSDLRYRETGSLYLTRTEIYRTRHNRLGGRIGLFVMDEAEGTDIDTVHDLALAERHLRAAPVDEPQDGPVADPGEGLV